MYCLNSGNGMNRKFRLLIVHEHMLCIENHTVNQRAKTEQIMHVHETFML